MRRKEGALLPLEIAILRTGLDTAPLGIAEFHGFEIAKRIEGVAGARRLTGYGSLYKALSRLEERGLLQSRWEEAEAAEKEHRPRRRLYRVTPEGGRALISASTSPKLSPRLAAGGAFA